MLNLRIITSFVTFLISFTVVSEAIALPCPSGLPRINRDPFYSLGEYCDGELEILDEEDLSILTVEASNISLIDRSRPNIFVREIEIVGNTAFPAEAFEEIIAPIKNRWVSPDELVAVRSAITDKYVEHGYLTSGAMALVPFQQISEGVADVKIEVIEGVNLGFLLFSANSLENLATKSFLDIAFLKSEMV